MFCFFCPNPPFFYQVGFFFTFFFFFFAVFPALLDFCVFWRWGRVDGSTAFFFFFSLKREYVYKACRAALFYVGEKRIGPDPAKSKTALPSMTLVGF